jgi:hypothetical protein
MADDIEQTLTGIETLFAQTAGEMICATRRPLTALYSGPCRFPRSPRALG